MQTNKSQKFLLLFLSLYILFLSSLHAASCPDPNMDYTLQDRICICKPGYILANGKCRVNYQMYKSNIFGFNMSLSSDAPQCTEGTMIVAGWFKLVPNKDLNQNVNATLIRRPNVFLLGQRNNQAFTRVESSDKNDTYFESSAIVTNRWVFQGFAVLQILSTYQYTSIVDRAVSQFGLAMNSTSHTPVDQVTNNYYHLCSGSCKQVRKVFYQCDLRMQKITQATIDFIAFNHQYKSGGALLSANIILNVVFNEGNSTYLPNYSSVSSFIDISENFNITWTNSTSDTPILCDSRYYTILSNGACQLDKAVLSGTNPQAFKVPLTNVKLNALTTEFSITFWFNAINILPGSYTVFNFDRTSLNVTLTKNTQDLFINFGSSDPRQAVPPDGWFPITFSAYNIGGVSWSTKFFTLGVEIYSEYRDIYNPFWLNSTTLYFLNVEGGSYSQGANVMIRNINVINQYLSSSDINWVNSFHFSRGSSHPKLVYYSQLKPTLYSTDYFYVDELNLGSLNADFYDFEVDVMPYTNVLCENSYQYSFNLCTPMTQTGCITWDLVNNQCLQCDESRNWLLTGSTCGCKANTYATGLGVCQKCHYSVSTCSGPKRSDGTCKSAFANSPCKCGTNYFFDGQSCQVLCGDGKTFLPEQCDDGNQESGDGCSQYCEYENGYQCENDAQSFSTCYPKNILISAQFMANYTQIAFQFWYNTKAVSANVTQLAISSDIYKVGSSPIQYLANSVIIIQVSNSYYSGNLNQLTLSLDIASFNTTGYQYIDIFNASLQNVTVQINATDSLSNYKPTIYNVTQSTTTITKCYGFMQVDLNYSTGFKQFIYAQFQWVSMDSSPSLALQNYLLSITNKSSAFFTSELFTVDTTSQIEVTLTNIQGYSTKSTFTVITSSKETNLKPTINPNAKQFLNVTKLYPLKLSAPILIDQCLASYYTLSDLTYKWTLNNGQISSLSQVSNRRSISLNLTNVQSNVLFNVTVTITGSPFFNGSLSYQFSVLALPLPMKAIIDGDEFQLITQGIRLSGWNSYDADTGRKTGLIYQWSCIKVNNTIGCPFSISASNSTTIQIPSSDLIESTSYHIQLKVFNSTDSRVGSQVLVVKSYLTQSMLIIGEELQYYYSNSSYIDFYGNLYSFGSSTPNFQRISWSLDNSIDITQYNMTSLSQPDIRLKSSLMEPNKTYTVTLSVFQDSKTITQTKKFKMAQYVSDIETTFITDQDEYSIQIKNYDTQCLYDFYIIVSGLLFIVQSESTASFFEMPQLSPSQIGNQESLIRCTTQSQSMSQIQQNLQVTLDVLTICDISDTLINYVSCFVYLSQFGANQKFDSSFLLQLAELQNDENSKLIVKSKEFDSEYLYPAWLKMCKYANEDSKCYQYLGKYMLSSQIIMASPMIQGNLFAQRIDLDQFQQLLYNPTNSTSFSDIQIKSKSKRRNLLVNRASKNYVDVLVTFNDFDHSLMISFTKSNSLSQLEKDQELDFTITIIGFSRLNEKDLIIKTLSNDQIWESDLSKQCSIQNIQTMDVNEKVYDVNFHCSSIPNGVKVQINVQSFFKKYFFVIAQVGIILIIATCTLIFTVSVCCKRIYRKKRFNVKKNDLFFQRKKKEIVESYLFWGLRISEKLDTGMIHVLLWHQMYGREQPIPAKYLEILAKEFKEGKVVKYQTQAHCQTEPLQRNNIRPFTLHTQQSDVVHTEVRRNHTQQSNNNDHSYISRLNILDEEENKTNVSFESMNQMMMVTQKNENHKNKKKHKLNSHQQRAAINKKKRNDQHDLDNHDFGNMNNYSQNSFGQIFDSYKQDQPPKNKQMVAGKTKQQSFMSGMKSSIHSIFSGQSKFKQKMQNTIQSTKQNPEDSSSAIAQQDEEYMKLHAFIQEEVSVFDQMMINKYRISHVFCKVSNLITFFSLFKINREKVQELGNVLDILIRGWFYMFKWFFFIFFTLCMLKRFDYISYSLPVYQQFALILLITTFIQAFFRIGLFCLPVHKKMDFDNEDKTILSQLEISLRQNAINCHQISYVDKLLICGFIKYINIIRNDQTKQSNIIQIPCLMLLVLANLSLFIGSLYITYTDNYYQDDQLQYQIVWIFLTFLFFEVIFGPLIKALILLFIISSIKSCFPNNKNIIRLVVWGLKTQGIQFY